RARAVAPRGPLPRGLAEAPPGTGLARRPAELAQRARTRCAGAGRGRTARLREAAAVGGARALAREGHRRRHPRPFPARAAESHLVHRGAPPRRGGEVDPLLGAGRRRRLRGGARPLPLTDELRQVRWPRAALLAAPHLA